MHAPSDRHTLSHAPLLNWISVLTDWNIITHKKISITTWPSPEYIQGWHFTRSEVYSLKNYSRMLIHRRVFDQQMWLRLTIIRTIITVDIYESSENKTLQLGYLSWESHIQIIGRIWRARMIWKFHAVYLNTLRWGGLPSSEGRATQKNHSALHAISLW